MTEDLLDKAINVILQAHRGSTALLQRRLKIPYFVAAELLQRIEDMGIVSKANGAKPRKVLN